MIDISRDMWLPDFDLEYREVVGQAWPIVVVNKFETNHIGERRFVDSRVVDLNVWEKVQAARPNV